MKIIMSKKEARLMKSIILNIVGEPIKDVPDVLKIENKKSEDYEDVTIIDINEEYVATLYGKVNKWLPTLVSHIKGTIEMIKLFIEEMSKTENNVLMKIKGSSSV